MAVKAAKPVRRRKADSARRDSLIKVLVTSEERDRFQESADANGISLSAWMRVIARQMTRLPTDDK